MIEPVRSEAAIERRRFRALLILLTLTLTLPFLGWGVPHATASDRVKSLAADEIVPLGTLADMHNMFVAPKDDWHLGYPWWHYAVAAAAQVPYLAYLKVTGSFDEPTGDFPFGLEDPVLSLKMLTLCGRIVSALMAVGIVLMTHTWVGRMFDEPAGRLAAVFTLLTQGFLYFARVGNVDLPALFWITGGLVAFAEVVVDRMTRRRLVRLGVFAGLAMATKDQALAVFLPLALYLLSPRARAAAKERPESWAPLFGLVASLFAYAFGSGMFFNPARQIGHVRALLFAPESVTAAVVYWPGTPRTPVGLVGLFIEHFHAFGAMMTPPLLWAAIFGAFAEKQKPGRLILWAPLIMILLMLTWPTGNVVRRYFLPLTPITAAFAAAGIRSLSQWRPWAGRAAVLLIVLVQAAVAVDLTYAQVRETRDAAAAWIRANTRAGDVIEFFGHEQKLPPVGADIVTRRAAGRERWEGEIGHGSEVLEYLEKDGPQFLIATPDWTSHPGEEESRDCPEEVFEALQEGRTSYALVAHFPTPRLLRGFLERPRLDASSVAPPVRIFARKTILDRLRPAPPGETK